MLPSPLCSFKFLLKWEFDNTTPYSTTPVPPHIVQPLSTLLLMMLMTMKMIDNDADPMIVNSDGNDKDEICDKMPNVF